MSITIGMGEKIRNQMIIQFMQFKNILQKNTVKSLRDSNKIEIKGLRMQTPKTTRNKLNYSVCSFRK